MAPPPRPVALFVAEKPSIAKTLAEVLSNGHARHRGSQFSRYNHMYDFDLDVQAVVHPGLPHEGKHLSVTVTSVSGHLMAIDFADKSQWRVNASHCFEDRIVETVNKGNEDIYQNLTHEAQRAQLVVIWTDCDREGEAIGAEVVRACQSVRPNILVRRARFSAANHADVWRAVNTLRELNENEIHAVEARSEIDLRLGAAFTRFQTVAMQQRFDQFAMQTVSFGSCQFPTMGFVVARYEAIESFQEETFYHIKMAHQCVRRDQEGGGDNDSPENRPQPQQPELFHFAWQRHRLYDFACALACYQLCVEAPQATVVQVTRKPKSKWRPVPLSTVELQVRASKWCRLASETAMKAAEILYQRGIVSYPRTETEVFAESFDLKALIQEHRASPTWGAFASQLLDEDGFQWPRAGPKNDQAHPPIHPVKFVPLEQLADDCERRVYELIVRHFLACCSKDAEGAESVLKVQVAGESFTATGLQVFQRNYLDVYPFEKWGEKAMPNLVEGDVFLPTVLELAEGKTQPPELMSEAELIRIMDTNGIGTDATIAEHIKTIQERQYVVKLMPQNRFKPTDLGLALVRSYNRMGHDRAISKPDLRAEMERDLKRICRGEINKAAVVASMVNRYRAILASIVVQKDDFLHAIAENLANTTAPEEAEYDEVLAAQLSRCGRCRMVCCDLMRKSANGARALVCSNCTVVCTPLPKVDEIRARPEICPICQYQVLEYAYDPQKPYRPFCPSCYSNCPSEMNAGDVEDVGQLACFRCAKEGCALATGKSLVPVGQCGTCNQAITVKKSQDRPGFYCACSARCPGGRATVLVPTSAKDVSITPDFCPLCPQFRILKIKFSAGDAPIAPPYELVECARTACPSHSGDYRVVVGMAEQSRPRAPAAVATASVPLPFQAPNPTQQHHSARQPHAGMGRGPAPPPRQPMLPVGPRFAGGNPGSHSNGGGPCPTCRQPMTQQTSSSASNPGRVYNKCVACNTFEWADEPRPRPTMGAPPMPPLSAGGPQVGAGGGVACYHCQGYGHLPIACPTLAHPAQQPAAPPRGGGAAGITCFKCHQPGHFANACPNGSAGGPAAGHVAAQQPRANVVCFRCNQPGHFANACPNPAAGGGAPPFFGPRPTGPRNTFQPRPAYAQQQPRAPAQSRARTTQAASSSSAAAASRRASSQPRHCDQCGVPFEPRCSTCKSCGFSRRKKKKEEGPNSSGAFASPENDDSWAYEE